MYYVQAFRRYQFTDQKTGEIISRVNVVLSNDDPPENDWIGIPAETYGFAADQIVGELMENVPCELKFKKTYKGFVPFGINILRKE